MCLSIPYQIKEIKGDKAIVSLASGKKRKINLNLLTGVKIGDWILSLNNFATQKITDTEAQEIIKLYNHE
ncbi:MAG TPA: HypC/HybG/HupF family hydrogenase formation chaperone [Candidatus Uhrbacteria bacterium]|nr:HypC/HybG/HupF family hydrogenase formation chaperone [Candidatus Uhrbacteria bacterium]